MSSEQQSDQAASNLMSPNGSLIGYCHQCDRQVEIDPDFYTCRRCNSGFIELFEGNDEAASADEAAETEINNPHSRVFRFDTGGPANFEVRTHSFKISTRYYIDMNQKSTWPTNSCRYSFHNS